MRTLARGVAVVIAALCFASCSDDAPTDPTDAPLFDGVNITASVVPLQDGKMVSVQARLTNITSAPIIMPIPAQCPIRIRMYRVLDDALVYDESQITCSTTPVVDVEIAPQGQRVVTSGGRFPWTLAGDSLPKNVYRLTGILRIAGEVPIELEAGLYELTQTAPPGVGASRQ